jgi:hypothetical protein
MVDPLHKPSDKADRPESPVPPGCGKMRRLRRCAPWLRRLNYDLRRTPHIHPHFASNAIRGGLNQRFLKYGSGSISAPFHNISCGSLRPFPLHAARVRVRGAGEHCRREADRASCAAPDLTETRRGSRRAEAASSLVTCKLPAARLPPANLNFPLTLPSPSRERGLNRFRTGSALTLVL